MPAEQRFRSVKEGPRRRKKARETPLETPTIYLHDVFFSCPSPPSVQTSRNECEPRNPKIDTAAIYAKSKMATLEFIFFTVLQLFHLCLSVNISNSANPNIIIFMVDNLSFGDFNNESQNTPNINRLVEQGVTFSRWYTQSSRISSLASILTGLLPPRTGIIRSKFLPFKEIPSLASSGGLQPSEKTLAKVLKSKGYKTGFVGLWGLGVGRNGEYLPLSHGFDSFYGVPSAHREHCTKTLKVSSESHSTWRPVYNIISPLVYICPLVGLVIWYYGHRLNIVTVLTVLVAFILYSSVLQDVIHSTMNFIQIRGCVLYKNNSIIEQPYVAENMTLHFTRSAVSFLDVASVSSKPFFLFVSSMSLEEPVFVSPLFSNLTPTLFHDAVLETDWSIGRIMKALRDHKLEQQTLILVTSATGHHAQKFCNDCSQQHGRVGDSTFNRSMILLFFFILSSRCLAKPLLTLLLRLFINN